MTNQFREKKKASGASDRFLNLKLTNESIVRNFKPNEIRPKWRIKAWGIFSLKFELLSSMLDFLIKNLHLSECFQSIFFVHKKITPKVSQLSYFVREERLRILIFLNFDISILSVDRQPRFQSLLFIFWRQMTLAAKVLNSLIRKIGFDFFWWYLNALFSV